ncbi:MAG: histidine--tRNA ligase [Lachnospiraceae bacterium]|nr:histidine--tRNA ligase [Lachnospiraceae bacterium]
MALKKTPVTGMKDVLPAEMQIRDYVMNQIKETYRQFGFSQIETPCVEHIENLTSKQGGDNEKLIFKILKRGNKLDVAQAQTETEVVDGGLRYDLTLPLSRYYANHAAELPSPFKALQMGSVWRAEHPQKGRFRQFVQCDIDILGDGTCLAEIELILATTAALRKICPDNSFTVRINDRGVLRGMAACCGFAEEDYDALFITLDKMDKIGMNGVKEELLGAGHTQERVEKYLELFTGISTDAAGVRQMGEKLAVMKEMSVAANVESAAEDKKIFENLAYIMETVEAGAEAEFSLVFDPTLVRGMSYYTGTIFEVAMEGFGGSVAGGGRYDKMIGKFTGKETPACGFSIGFERIVTILLDNGFRVPGEGQKKAYLFEKGVNQEILAQVIREASAERKAGVQVLVAQMNKNKKFQKEQLSKEGYTEFREFYKDPLKK